MVKQDHPQCSQPKATVADQAQAEGTTAAVEAAVQAALGQTAQLVLAETAALVQRVPSLVRPWLVQAVAAAARSMEEPQAVADQVAVALEATHHPQAQLQEPWTQAAEAAGAAQQACLTLMEQQADPASWSFAFVPHNTQLERK